MARGEETRNKILGVAQGGVLAKSFDATSIEEIVAAANITKSGFFIISPIKMLLLERLLIGTS
jgi:TetR/AcrR family transcriptional repressor of nem operon